MINKSELLKNLRSLTQAGMNDCKSALEEANWNLDQAVDIVKAKGLANAASRQSLVASEGIVKISTPNVLGSYMIELNCGTDFVAKSEGFLALANKLVDHSFMYRSDPWFQTEITNLIATTKENIVFRRSTSLNPESDNQIVGSYTHSNNKIGVLALFEVPEAKDTSSPVFAEFMDNVLMQIAAMNPLALDRSKLNSEEVERQKKIFETQLQELNKPETAWPKILEGKLEKWYKEVCLVDQESLTQNKISIQNYTDNVSKTLCEQPGKVKILQFARYQVGEGIEKKQDDFVSEVERLSGINNAN